MLALLVSLIVLILIETLIWRYGADTRDGKDWSVPRSGRESPRAG